MLHYTTVLSFWSFSLQQKKPQIHKYICYCLPNTTSQKCSAMIQDWSVCGGVTTTAFLYNLHLNGTPEVWLCVVNPHSRIAQTRGKGVYMHVCVYICVFVSLYGQCHGERLRCECVFAFMCIWKGLKRVVSSIQWTRNHDHMYVFYARTGKCYFL